jgi:hypothetical protein
VNVINWNGGSDVPPNVVYARQKLAADRRPRATKSQPVGWTGVGRAGGAANLLASMDRSPQRDLTPDDRDFFAVYVCDLRALEPPRPTGRTGAAAVEACIENDGCQRLATAQAARRSKATRLGSAPSRRPRPAPSARARTPGRLPGARGRAAAELRPARARVRTEQMHPRAAGRTSRLRPRSGTRTARRLPRARVPARTARRLPRARVPARTARQLPRAPVCHASAYPATAFLPPRAPAPPGDRVRPHAGARCPAAWRRGCARAGSS